MARDLILLTHQYPFAAGDASFVEAEIGALAACFDNVYVWTLSPSRLGRVAVPSNVNFVGSLLSDRLSSPLLLVRALAHLPSYLRLAMSELFERRGRLRLIRLLRSTAVAVVGGARLNRWLKTRELMGRESVLYSFWGTDSALAVVPLTNRPLRTAVRLHGYDLYEERVGYLPFRRLLFDRADVLLTASRHGAEYLDVKYSGRYELPPVVVSRLGTPDLGSGSGAPSDVVRVVSCSSIIGLKRVGLIFDVVNKLAETRKVHWVHFGDGPLRAQLSTKFGARSSDLTIDMRGQVERSQILDFYKNTKVSMFVNLSTTEGLPVSIMEAMSFGIPVIATDVGGTSEIVGRSHGSGILVSVKAAAREIVKIAEEILEPVQPLSPRQTWNELCNADKNGRATSKVLNS